MITNWYGVDTWSRDLGRGGLPIWSSPEDVSLIAQECLTLSCQNNFNYPNDIISLKFTWHLMCSLPLSCVLPLCQEIRIIWRIAPSTFFPIFWDISANIFWQLAEWSQRASSLFSLKSSPRLIFSYINHFPLECSKKFSSDVR